MEVIVLELDFSSGLLCPVRMESARHLGSGPHVHGSAADFYSNVCFFVKRFFVQRENSRLHNTFSLPLISLTYLLGEAHGYICVSVCVCVCVCVCIYIYICL